MSGDVTQSGWHLGHLASWHLETRRTLTVGQVSKPSKDWIITDYQYNWVWNGNDKTKSLMAQAWKKLFLESEIHHSVYCCGSLNTSHCAGEEKWCCIRGSRIFPPDDQHDWRQKRAWNGDVEAQKASLCWGATIDSVIAVSYLQQQGQARGVKMSVKTTMYNCIKTTHSQIYSLW